MESRSIASIRARLAPSAPLACLPPAPPSWAYPRKKRSGGTSLRIRCEAMPFAAWWTRRRSRSSPSSWPLKRRGRSPASWSRQVVGLGGQSITEQRNDIDVGSLCRLPFSFFLEEDEGPDHDVFPASRISGRGRVGTGSMERPARNGTVGHRVIAFEHRDLGRLLLREPVPLVVRTIREAGGLADAVIVDPVVGDVGLVGEGRPGAEHERKLLDCLDWLGEVDRHEPPRHLRVGLFLCQ